jgi:hypothetical protein
MKDKYIQLFSIFLSASLLVAPSLAFPGRGPKFVKYSADLYYGGVIYGKAVFNTNNEGSGYELEVEIEECTLLAGETAEVLLHQNYYNMILIGNVYVDLDGNGKTTLYTELLVNEFTLIVEGSVVLSSEEGWNEWEKQVKELKLQVTPKSINQKSKGKWVTAKTSFINGEISDIKLYMDDKEVEELVIEQKNGKLKVKFLRSQLIDLVEPGIIEVKLIFNLDGEEVELTDTVKIIHQEKQETIQQQNHNNQSKGKAKGKAKHGKTK